VERGLAQAVLRRRPLGLPRIGRISTSRLFTEETATTPSLRVFLAQEDRTVDFLQQLNIALRVNGHEHRLAVDARVTLLDALRERLGLTGTKKGCNFGECGACTVHLDGRRVNACMVLVASVDGREVTTIEGLAKGDELHPVQQAFIDHDGFQCGFCTPGQIMSAVALIEEGHVGSEAEIREWMSGNLCRCSAYPQIVEAVQAAAIGRAAR
jgi:xanthine dehydrogenase YagT iron-sulfur-binding subunit